MANNENVNKVSYAGETLIDLTGDTAQASDVLIGKTFHTKSGAQAVGTLSEGGVVIYDGLDSTSTTEALSANQGRVLNGKKQYMEYVSAVADFNTFCSSLAIGTSACVNATQTVMNAVVGRNSFGMLYIVKISSSAVYIMFANPYQETLGTCSYTFTTSTTSRLNDIGSANISTKSVTVTVNNVTYGDLYIIKKNDTVNLTWTGNSNSLPNDTVLLADTTALIPYGQHKINIDIGFPQGKRGAIAISSTGEVKATGFNDGSIAYTSGFVSYIAHNSTALT